MIGIGAYSVRIRLCGVAVVSLTGAVSGQGVDISWYTVDGGGGTATGGGFSLSGTIGQFDAGVAGGGGLLCDGGFWVGVGTAACYANCDGSSLPPILNVQDFGCFLNLFSSGDPYANCDASTTTPVLNVLDFGCFLNKFAAGCS